jgi:large subunit ribosomal protein L25
VPGLTLEASKRSILGKKTRFLRRQGITPTHLFGHGVKSISIQCNTADLQRTIAQAGTTRLVSLAIEGDKQPRSVLIREIQREVIGDALLHVDFFQIRKTERLKAEVPIILVGEAPALKFKERTLMHGITSLDIECLPDKLPPQIEVDISSLEEPEQAILVKDIVLDPDIHIATDPDQPVVKVSEARAAAVEEEVVEEEAVVAEEEARAGAPAEEEPEAKE